ncbi:MAG: AI-2E family transporter [Flavipsychrobacter sp.]
MMREIKLPFYAQMALVLISIVIILILMRAGSLIFIPLFFALLISVTLYPLCDRMERTGLPRSLAAFLSILLFIIGMGAFIYLLAVQIISFSQDFPEFRKRIILLIADLQEFISRKYHVNASQQIDYLNNSTTNILERVANSIGGLFTSVLEVVIWTIFVFVFSYFILFHRRLLYRFITSLFKPSMQDKVNTVIADTRSIINHYILGLLLEMTIMTVVNCSVFFLLGVKYALLLGMLAAVLNIVPYLGIYTAMTIGMLVTFANGTLNEALGVGISLIVVHFFDANVLMPRIVGSRVKMNALITILAVLTGNLVWGIAGMFLFIPLTAILKVIFEQIEATRPWALLIGAEDKLQRKK